MSGGLRVLRRAPATSLPIDVSSPAQPLPADDDLGVAPSLAERCDSYLDARTGHYGFRRVRYQAAWSVMDGHGGLVDADLLLDVGAGATELDFYLRAERGWRGRYWPVDGWQGVDLAGWSPGRPVDWSVALEVVEHLTPHDADQLLMTLQACSAKGVVVSTPNPESVDVLAMDDTHLWPVPPGWLEARGFTVHRRMLYGREDDSLLAWWTP